MCLVYLLHRKAVEHHRTPKRKRNYRVEDDGHVLECGSVLPLLSASHSLLLLCHRNRRLLDSDCQSCGYVNPPQWHPRRFEVEDFAKQVPRAAPSERFRKACPGQQIAADVEQPAMWCTMATLMFLRRGIVSIFFAAGFLAGGDLAVAGNPIGDFFKRLGDSIAHPHSSPTPSRNGQKSSTGKKQSGNEKVVPPEMPPTPSVPPAPTPTPTQPPVRTAGGVPPTRGLRRDMPYGIPVPNKPGLVTSPYAPKSGYVDVRGFPSGTEVKDPYTGKVFLTP
jgi:hypothetical protein